MLKASAPTFGTRSIASPTTVTNMRPTKTSITHSKSSYWPMMQIKNPKTTECRIAQAHSGITPGNIAITASAEAEGAAAPKKNVTSAR